MRVSRNELVAVLRQAFEGLGFFQGDYENAAEMVVWSEMHALQGLAELEQVLTAIDQRSKVAITSNPTTVSKWDVAGASSFECADLAMGLLQAKAQHDDCVVLRLMNCHFPEFIAKNISEARKQGLYVAALWRHAEAENVLRVCSHAAGLELPEYLEFDIPLDSSSDMTDVVPGQLHLIASVSAQNVSDAMPGETVSHCLAVPDMQAAYEYALQQGIQIESSLWRLLLRLGERVLVEATEQSRLGAGA